MVNEGSSPLSPYKKGRYPDYSNELQSGYSKGDEVRMLVRPDDIIHDDDAITSAKVIEKTFRGSDFLYRLELKDKQTVFCYAPSHHNHSLNEVIGVKLDLDHLIVFED